MDTNAQEHQRALQVPFTKTDVIELWVLERWLAYSVEFERRVIRAMFGGFVPARWEGVVGSVSGSVIMSRLVTDDGVEVVIEVGKPTPAEHGAECTFRIDEHRFHSHGTDELAALHTAVIEIGRMLARANRDAERARFALPAELGFPDPTATGTDDATSAAIDSGVDEVIARRTIDHDGRRHNIALGRPFGSPDRQLALCPFQVDGRPRAVAGGWDGMQAFLTAVGMIGAWLNLPPDWPSTTAP